MSCPQPNAEISLTRNDTGIVLDFLMRDDPRVRTKKRAWLLFQAGLFIAGAAIIGYATARLTGMHEFAAIAFVPFGLGLVLFVAAAQISSNAWDSTEYDDDLQQLAVAGNLLVRTTRDLRKQIWYRDEIQAIRLDADLLIVSLRGGVNATLLSQDQRSRAQLEWIATQLQQGIHGSVRDAADRLTHAIQSRDTSSNDAQIKP